MVPVASVIPDFLAVAADGEHAFQVFHFGSLNACEAILVWEMGRLEVSKGDVCASKSTATPKKVSSGRPSARVNTFPVKRYRHSRSCGDLIPAGGRGTTQGPHLGRDSFNGVIKMG